MSFLSSLSFIHVILELTLAHTLAQVSFDQGDNHFETPWKPLQASMQWGTISEEFHCGDVDARLKLKFYLCYETKGNVDRAAYCVLNVNGFPYMQVSYPFSM